MVVCLTERLGPTLAIYDSRNCGGVSDVAAIAALKTIYDSRNCGGVSDKSSQSAASTNLRQ